MIAFGGKGARIGEVWFATDASEAGLGVDVLYYNQAQKPSPKGTHYAFTTLVIDLHRSEDELARGVAKGTLYEIRRAEQKDGLVFEFTLAPSAEQLSEFQRFFGEFAGKKGLGSLGSHRLKAYADAGCLSLGFARDGQADTILSAHAYVSTLGRARLWYSASSRLEGSADPAEKARIGRANRWLHWREILAYRERGFTTYDLGGWHPAPSDKQLEGINRFKEGFSTTKEESYCGCFPVTTRGRAYLWLKGLLSGR